MLLYEFKISGASFHICCSGLFTPALLYMLWTILSSTKAINLCCQSICIYHIDGILYSQPYGYIGEDFCNTSPVSKRSFLKYRKIRHNLCCQSICIYHIDGILYSQPYGYIGEDFCNTSPVSKRSFLKYRKIRHLFF